MKKPKKMPYGQLKKVAEELGGCVLWALKFCKVPGQGLMVNADMSKAGPWEERFMDALDKCGYMIDREKFYENKHKRKR